jgi:hypothetical protein
MKKKEKETLLDLLYALYNRSKTLVMMQECINEGNFDYAIWAQLEYLYQSDEVLRLFPKHARQLDELLCNIYGINK